MQDNQRDRQNSKSKKTSFSQPDRDTERKQSAKVTEPQEDENSQKGDSTPGGKIDS